jgi:hypothetical protein
MWMSGSDLVCMAQLFARCTRYCTGQATGGGLKNGKPQLVAPRGWALEVLFL